MICDVTCEVNINLDFAHIFVVDRLHSIYILFSSGEARAATFMPFLPCLQRAKNMWKTGSLLLEIPDAQPFIIVILHFLRKFLSRGP